MQGVIWTVFQMNPPISLAQVNKICFNNSISLTCMATKVINVVIFDFCFSFLGQEKNLNKFFAFLGQKNVRLTQIYFILVVYLL
jgi:hypothetical protein